MGLDSGLVFKRPVLCSHCNEERLFTLRAIADSPTLKCAGCGSSIQMSHSIYEPLIRDVRKTLAALDSVPSIPFFDQPAGLHRLPVTRFH
jgi:hypothetical protein